MGNKDKLIKLIKIAQTFVSVRRDLNKLHTLVCTIPIPQSDCVSRADWDWLRDVPADLAIYLQDGIGEIIELLMETVNE